MAVDKRIIRTRTNIKNSFMQIMLEKDLEDISISDVAAKANINRSTFYLHYQKVKDILIDIEREISSHIMDCLSKFDITKIYESTYNMFTSLSNIMEENEIFKTYILYSTNCVNFAARLKDIFVSKTRAAILDRFPTVRSYEIEYPLTFAAGGIIDCYIKWGHSSPNQLTLDNLVKMVSNYTQIIIQSIRFV